ncbi:pantetheine-phosphate adenylyltransferase [Pisciglobus halotolerans]|uniref:Phosphopantetheine adenylyltransferase n=1 Tax=Pisciglobus halotolerans TaxID=745365 RepID=A0A1I3BEY9_9LACT|nr:pantetheine-phosphate adenylyltransferase [Pisciglobus halotolerans]SFH60848.1 Phosphopantetheine adenylyltransferase [Pisciglobus halotolerans]
MTKIALFPGSFDPMTNGHLSTIKSACKLFDQVVIAVSTNSSKTSLFSAEEKMTLIETATKDLPNTKVIEHTGGLTVELARKINATSLIRGLRNTQDFEYEAAIAAMNKTQLPELDTVFFMADERYRFVSSSLIKEVAMFGGDVSHLVPEQINDAIIEKYKRDKIR